MNKSSVLCLPILLVLPLLASALDFEDLPVPSQAKLKIISNQLIQNGVPMILATLESNESFSTTARFYRQLWSAKQVVKEGQAIPGYVQSEFNEWLVLSRLDQGVNTVIQFDTSIEHRTIAYISRLNVTTSVQPTPSNRLFPELVQVSSTQSEDNRIRSTLSVYTSRASVHATARRSINTLLHQGWQIVAEGAEALSISLVFSKGPERLDVVVTTSQDHPAVVVANHVEEL